MEKIIDDACTLAGEKAVLRCALQSIISRCQAVTTRDGKFSQTFLTLMSSQSMPSP